MNSCWRCSRPSGQLRLRRGDGFSSSPRFRLSPFIVSMTMQLAYKGHRLMTIKPGLVAVPHPCCRRSAISSCSTFFPDRIFLLAPLLLAVLTELFLRNTQFGHNLFLVGA